MRDMFAALLSGSALLCGWAPEALAALTSRCGDDGSNSTCPMERESYYDQSSILQFQALRADPCAAEINTGICDGVDGCQDCRPDGDGRIPDGSRFPNGYLKCASGLADKKACFGMLENDFYEFRSSSDYLICDGEGHCKGDWNVNNVGAVCCTAEEGDTQACNNAAKLNLTTDPDSQCVQDVCCDCDQACCYESFFTGVNSLSCLGGTSCTQSRFEIQRNLFCSSTSTRTGNTLQGACNSGTDNYPLGYGFLFTDSGEHCVTCEGEDTCQGANFWFEETGSKISMTCDGKGFATACESSSTVIGLFGNSCLHLTCVETGDCDSLEIRVVAGSGNTCYCSGAQAESDGNCDFLGGDIDCDYAAVGSNPCSLVNDPCGETACCQAAFGSDSAPDCGGCCAPYPTTAPPTVPPTTAPPTTAPPTTAPPTTAPPTTAPPTTAPPTTAPPTTAPPTTAPPTTAPPTTAPPTTAPPTTAPPTTAPPTTAPPTTAPPTTAPPTTAPPTTAPPTTAPPTTAPPTTAPPTTAPPTTAPPTTAPPTTAPPTTAPPTTAPPTTAPPTTTAPDATTTAPDVTTTAPDITSTTGKKPYSDRYQRRIRRQRRNSRTNRREYKYTSDDSEEEEV